MSIFDIPESLFHRFQLVAVHLDLFNILLIAVELVQSYFLAGGHLRVAGLQFDVQVCNLNGKDGSFVDIYHVFIIFIVVNSRIIRNEQVIFIPNVHAQNQKICKGSRKIFLVLELVRLW